MLTPSQVEAVKQTLMALGKGTVESVAEPGREIGDWLSQQHGENAPRLGALAGPLATIAMGATAPETRGVGLAAKAAELPMDAASRMARAQEMGFRLGMPLMGAQVPSDERIAQAALNVNGRIFTGNDHLEAMLNAEKSLGIPFEQMQHAPIMDGFTTTGGRFVSRWEAGDIARRSSQGETGGIFGATSGLASEDVARAPSGATARSSVHIGATAPGLPGGRGVWTSLAAEPAQMPAASDALLHRADRPAAMDVAGAAEHEIQAALQDAWGAGHDAVMLRNYTRPGGENPENVIVVRDLSQLRSPNAAFDPTRKFSPELLASMGGLSVIPLAASSDGSDGR
jgi:hypothetical protein